MRTISTTRRVIYTLIVLLAFVLVIEGVLRVIGWAYLQRARAEFGPATSPAILTLGDSFTYGIGADTDGSYPAHLGELLGDDWRVVNGGHPYMDSTSLLATFSSRVLAAKPRVVVVMVGYNNQFKNPNRPSPEASPWSGMWRRLRGLKIAQLLHILQVNRAVDTNTLVAAEIPALSAEESRSILAETKFADVAAVFAAHQNDHRKVLQSPATDPDTLLAKGLAYLMEGEGRLAAPLFFRVLAERPDSELALMGAGYVTLYRREIVIGFMKIRFRSGEPYLASGIAQVLFDLGRRDEAIATLRKVVDAEPRYTDSMLLLAGFYLKNANPAECLVLLERLEVLEPWRAELHWMRAEALMALDHWPRAEKSFDRALRDGLEHPSYYARLRRQLLALPTDPDAYLRDRPAAYALGPSAATWRGFAAYTLKRLRDQGAMRTTDNLYDDLIEMNAVAANLGVRLVLMSYPDRYAYDELRDFATTHDVPFVDNVVVFEENLRTVPPDKLFQPDGHCTSLGYRLMAENLRHTLETQKLLTPGAAP